jgi:hypothetical protein
MGDPNEPRPSTEGWSPSFQLKRARWWLEVAALGAGAFWVVGELTQGMYNPAAELTIKSIERRPVLARGSDSPTDKDYLVVAATLKASRGRLEVQTGQLLIGDPDDPKLYRLVTCAQLDELAIEGLIPPGDSSDFACVAQVSRRGCLSVRLRVDGVRAVPLFWRIWPTSHWISSGVSCGSGDR